MLKKLAVLLFTLAAESVFGQAATAPILQKNVAQATDLTDGVLGTGRIAKESALAGIGTQGYQPNQTLGGCGVQYVTLLQFTVGSCTYTVAGVTYTSAITDVTLSAADPTNPRIDVIAVDTTGVVVVLVGTPAATPAAADVDPATQLQLTFVYIAAAATTPSNVTTDNIYDENVEWTCSPTATINCNSTNNPYRNTHDIEATASGTTRNFTLVKPAAGTVDLSTRNNLIFYIRSKAVWPTGTSGSTAARFLSIFWQNGSTQRGLQVVLRDGAFGFSSSNTASYQQISIPTSLFGNAGIPVTTLRFNVSGPSGTSTIGFYIDAISLQAGVTPPSLPTTLMNFKGTWSAATAYQPNDTVVSGGLGYVALVANTNVAVTTTATWAPVGPGNLTGDVNSSGLATTLANIPSGTPMAGSLLATAITAPGTPAAGKASAYVDSTSKNFAVKDDAGVVKHGVQTQAGSANNWITAINDAGVASTAQPASSNLSDYATVRVRTFGLTVDGGGSAITNGVKGDTQVNFACTITSWTIQSDQSGSIQFDIWKTAYAATAPTVANTITAAAKPLTSSVVNDTSSTLTGWTTSVAAGDIIRFNVDSATTVTRATLSVKCLI